MTECCLNGRLTTVSWLDSPGRLMLYFYVNLLTSVFLVFVMYSNDYLYLVG